MIFFFSVPMYKNENANSKKNCVKAKYEKFDEKLITCGKKNGK